MEDNKMLAPEKVRSLRIANIIFTILASAAFIVALVFLGTGIDSLNVPPQTDGVNLEGLGFALCFILYLIVGVISAVFALISFLVSLGGFKQRKPESVIHLIWNIVIIVGFIAGMIAFLVINANR